MNCSYEYVEAIANRPYHISLLLSLQLEMPFEVAAAS